MSRFLNPKYKDLAPYEPGEQPEDGKFIKLNTTGSPFPPPQAVADAVADTVPNLQLYPDQDCRVLTYAVAAKYGVEDDEVILSNGSGEIMNFAFMAFCDAYRPVVFPNITCGLYPVLADLNDVKYETIPLRDDFTVNIGDYIGIGKTIFLANPNSPTGLSLHRSVIERIIEGNRDSVVVIDEAYVDFGAESCVPLIKKYDNLLVVGTFSKSRSLAGARLGFAFGCRELICDLYTVKNSINPYNINRMTAAAGLASLKNDDIAAMNCRTIVETREYTKSELCRLGFRMTDSAANFVFVKHPKIGGEALYIELKKRGILVRHFDAGIIRDYNRITIGAKKDMMALISVVEEILENYR